MSIENPIINDYIIELPELINILPTKSEFLTLLEDEEKNSPMFAENWDGQSWYNCDHTKVSNAISTFHSNVFSVVNSKRGLSTESWLCKKENGKWIPPHVEQDSLAVLIYPIDPESYDIQFTDKWADTFIFTEAYKDTMDYEYDVIHTHTYTCPTLINAKIPHCVPNKEEKITFYMNCYFAEDFTSWNHLEKLQNTNKLLTI